MVRILGETFFSDCLLFPTAFSLTYNPYTGLSAIVDFGHSGMWFLVFISLGTVKDVPSVFTLRLWR